MMGLLDRLFGGNRGGVQDQPAPHASRTQGPQDTPVPGRGGPGRATGDEAAIQRYRYLLRTAPPEAIEQAHAEAFAALTPDQRRTVLAELGSQVPAAERATSDDPQALARMATRAEMRQPGTMERTFSRSGGMGGMGMGGVLAGGLFASLAGAFVGTAIANEIFDDQGADGSDGNDSGSDQAGDQSGDQGDAQAAGNDGTDGGFGDAGSGDTFGGGPGGGDFGSGDFGGGGDFGGFDA